MTKSVTIVETFEPEGSVVVEEDLTFEEMLDHGRMPTVHDIMEYESRTRG